MAQFIFNVPDNQVSRIVDAFSANYNYQTQVANPSYDPELPIDSGNQPLMTNPETQGQFVRRQIRNFMKENVVAYEKKQQISGLSQISPPDVTDG